jgi:F-box protein 11
MRGLNPQETQNAIASFKNEAVMLANLTHPNLPRIYDHFEERGRWYLVMDYIDGETLATRMEKVAGGKFSIPEVIKIGLQLCTVLGYLHGHQPPIIFRDLKPDNVMITQDDHLYLIDFGIARFFKPGQARDTVNLGTPGYAAPEQYGRMQTTIRSDIYSLGATLYQLISGIYPGLNPFNFQPLNLDPQEPGNTALETLIMQMLEIKEDKRPADTDDVRLELQHIQQMRQAAPAETVINPPSQVSVPPINTPAPTALDLQQSLVVSQHGDGQYATISEAIQIALPNALILVKTGIYTESLVLDKDVDIIGNGTKEQIILESNDNHCVVMQTSHASIRGLTIRCQAGQESKPYHAFDIPQGQLFIEDCSITSNSSACIVIHNAAANPTIRYCTVYSGASNGIVVYDDAQSTIEYCDIFECSEPGISIATGGNPVFRHCTIHHSQQHGVFAHNSAQGTFEDCDIYSNGYSAVVMASQSNLLLLRCQLHHNQQYGVNVYQEGRGSIQDCDIYSNTFDNVVVTTGSTPYFYLCKIRDGEQSGVTVKENGKPVIEYCDVSANRSTNISISSGGDLLIRYSKIRDSQQSGIHVYDGGQGTVEYCTLTGNADKALDIAPQCNVILRGNRT